MCLYGLVVGISLFQIGFDLCDFGHSCFGFGMFALPFECTDLFGHTVASGLQLFGTHLQSLTLRFQCVEGGRIKNKPALCQFGGYSGGIGTEKLDI